jgi:hypothetical protein
MLIGELTPEEMTALYRGIAKRPLAVRQEEHKQNVELARWEFGCDNDDCMVMDDGIPQS